jgi:hypothetical protein
LFSVRFADHGVPLEFSSALPMVDSLHTNCRLTRETRSSGSAEGVVGNHDPYSD